MLVLLLCFSLLSFSSLRLLQLFHLLHHFSSDSVFPSHALAPTVTDIVKIHSILLCSLHLLSYGYYSSCRAKTSWSASCTEDQIVACLPQTATSPHAKMCKFVCSLALHQAKAAPFPDTGVCRDLNALSLHFSKQSEQNFYSLPIVFPEHSDNNF